MTEATGMGGRWTTIISVAYCLLEHLYAAHTCNMNRASLFAKRNSHAILAQFCSWNNITNIPKCKLSNGGLAFPWIVAKILEA